MARSVEQALRPRPRPGPPAPVAADRIPAGFHDVHVALEADGFTAARTLGVEIARREPPAPPTLPERIAEALAVVAARGEPDP